MSQTLQRGSPFRRSLTRTAAAAMSALMVMLTLPGNLAVAADGSVTGNKTVADTDISCGGSTTVTLTLNGQTGVAGNPADIMLVLDRSGSMGGTPLANLKSGANQFVDIMDEQTDGVMDGVIGNGSRIGVVSFASSATADQALTSNVAAIKAAINSLSASGLTNHEAAFQVGQSQLTASQPTNTKIMIMFTDGQTTAGGSPNDDAAAARAAGTEIYAIGLGSVSVSQLNNWATDPDSSHVYITPDSSDLDQIFQAIGAAIVVPAATNITVADTVNSRFSVSGAAASKGSVVQTGNLLTWTIAELNTETVTMTYTVTHDATQPGGTIVVNDSVTYTDAEGKGVTFPSPTVDVHGCIAHLTLTPAYDTNTVGDTHTVTATVTDDFGDPVSGVKVSFGVTGGPSSVDGSPSAPNPASGDGLTDANGQATFSYTNSKASLDTITAMAGDLQASAQKQWHPIKAMIDIKPGSDPSRFGSKSNGKIPVALFGSASFDVSMVNDASVMFGDAPDPIGDAADTDSTGQPEDKNGDGYMDKVYHFEFQQTHLDPGDTEGCLGGQIGGLDFMGCSDVEITG